MKNESYIKKYVMYVLYIFYCYVFGSVSKFFLKSFVCCLYYKRKNKKSIVNMLCNKYVLNMCANFKVDPSG